MTTIKQEYVLGFLFDESGKNVVLITKNRPDCQKGLPDVNDMSYASPYYKNLTGHDGRNRQAVFERLYVTDDTCQFCIWVFNGQVAITDKVL